MARNACRSDDGVRGGRVWEKRWLQSQTQKLCCSRRRFIEEKQALFLVTQGVGDGDEPTTPQVPSQRIGFVGVNEYLGM